jgi:hypothetical protein
MHSGMVSRSKKWFVRNILKPNEFGPMISLNYRQIELGNFRCQLRIKGFKMVVFHRLSLTKKVIRANLELTFDRSPVHYIKFERCP